MSAPIRTDDLSKYAPRWLREGTVKPRDPTGLPPAPRLSPEDVDTDEPPWRGPSPFDGDVRQWRSPSTHDQAYEQTYEPGYEPEYEQEYEQTYESQTGTTMPIYVSNRVHISLAGKLFGTTAAFSCAVIAMGALGLLLFPNASRDTVQTQNKSKVSTAESRTASSTQPEAVPPGKSTSRVSDLWPDPASAPSASTVNKAAPTTEAAPASQFANAVYVVANADQSTLPASRSQPQQQLDPPPASPPQVQPAAAPLAAAQRVASLAPQPALNVGGPGADEIDRMVKRGEAFLAQGDVTAARVLLERAAEARDPRAALALGSTYDPNVLKKMGTVGFKPDPEQAHMWYTRAAEYGSGEASQRLTALAH
jgi:hypothetical protein